jgi:ABC-type glycerol-3-phosphate transport system substrate-binding protein
MRATNLWLALLTVISLVAGCSAEPQTAAPTTALPTPAATTAPATPVPAPTIEVVQPTIITLRLWLPEELNPYNRAQSRGYLLRQLARFSSTHPDLSVEVVVKSVHGRGGMLDFLRTAPDVAPSVMPDLMVINAEDLREAADSTLIQPLDDLLPPSVANDRYSFATDMGRVGDRTMGFVLGVRALHQVYRAEAFDTAPLNWTDVISASGPFLFPAGGRNGEVNDATLIQYLAAGGAVTDPDGNPWLDRGPMVQVFSFYSRCIDTGVISPTAVLNITDSTQAWEQFRASGAALALVDAGDYRREADETTAAAPPPTRYSEPLAVARGWVVTMVSDDPARQALAMLLFDWLIGSEQNAAWTLTEGYLPGTRSAVMFWDAPEGERIMLGQLLEVTVPAPPRDVMVLVGPGMQRGLEALLNGQASPSRAAAIAIDFLRQ